MFLTQPYNRTDPFSYIVNAKNSTGKPTFELAYNFLDFWQVWLTCAGTCVAIFIPFLITVADYAQLATIGTRVRVISATSIPFMVTIFAALGLLLTSLLYQSYPELYYTPVTSFNQIFVKIGPLTNGIFVTILALIVTLSMIVTSVLLNLVPMSLALLSIFKKLPYYGAYLISCTVSLVMVPIIVYTSAERGKQSAMDFEHALTNATKYGESQAQNIPPAVTTPLA